MNTEEPISRIEEQWYVDIPDHLNIGIDQSFINIGTFSTKKEAIEWMRDNIDQEITDDGYLRILAQS